MASVLACRVGNHPHAFGKAGFIQWQRHITIEPANMVKICQESAALWLPGPSCKTICGAVSKVCDPGEQKDLDAANMNLQITILTSFTCSAVPIGTGTDTAPHINEGICEFAAPAASSACNEDGDVRRLCCCVKSGQVSSGCDPPLLVDD